MMTLSMSLSYPSKSVIGSIKSGAPVAYIFKVVFSYSIALHSVVNIFEYGSGMNMF